MLRSGLSLPEKVMDGLSKTLTRLFAGASVVAAATCAGAQTVMAPTEDSAALRGRLAQTMAAPGRPVPGDSAQLDAWYDQKDYGPLTQRLRSVRNESEVLLDISWEQKKLIDGGGFMVAYATLYDTWRVGAALPAESGTQFKDGAVVAFLYALDLAIVDGVRCADPSAPGHRVDQLVMQNRDLVRYLVSLPIARRMELGSISLQLEAATAPIRREDSVLCSGGMEEISHDLKANGDNPLPSDPSRPGGYVVPSAPGYNPGFLAADQVAPKLAQARRQLPANLTKFLAGLDRFAPASASQPKPTTGSPR
jgi:hypothetical protein